MKNLLLFAVLSLIGTALQAQERPAKYPISLSYFSHAVIHPGMKVGTQVDFKQWATEKEGKKATFTKT